MTDSRQGAPVRPSTRSQRQPPASAAGALLDIAANLSQYHREHEKYYSEAPLADAISLQRVARTLIALAERWESAKLPAAPAPSPYAGTPDLNDERAIETSGVLFMEGEGEPAEITRIKAELGTIAASSEQSGSWLATAMEASWDMAEALLSYPQLADLKVVPVDAAQVANGAGVKGQGSRAGRRRVCGARLRARTSLVQVRGAVSLCRRQGLIGLRVPDWRAGGPRGGA